MPGSTSISVFTLALSCAALLVSGSFGCGKSSRDTRSEVGEAARVATEQERSQTASGVSADPGDDGDEHDLPGNVRLVVLIVVDQLPSWSFDRDAALLKGGIARLIKSGVFYPEAEYPYSITYTAPGHAALGTGAPPS
ncbi:MAG: alkaline phosphatase family protein, partial [Myxococcota bacterium]